MRIIFFKKSRYTSNENSNYYFDVIPKHFVEILDMFASFFTSPLFTESATERELNAVIIKINKKGSFWTYKKFAKWF